MPSLHAPLSLGAQTSYAELFDMAQSAARTKFAALRGSFHRRRIKGKTYVYFNFRDIDGTGRSTYVGPETEKVASLVGEIENSQALAGGEALSQRSKACIALGCFGLPDKSFRVISKLASYGFFRAGGVLVGQHAFLSIGNMLGVRWSSDPAELGHNITIGFPRAAEIVSHDTITALEMGQMPVREFGGYKGSQRAPYEGALQVDFLTPDFRGEIAGVRPELGIPLQPRKFLELLLEDTTQGVVFGKSGACLVNLPDPARMALHMILVSTQLPASEREVSAKELEQAAALIEWHLDHGREGRLREVRLQALRIGPDWGQCIEQGLASFSRTHSSLAMVFE